MKNIFTILSAVVLILASSFTQAQIQVLTGTEYGTYYSLAQDMNKLLPTVKGVKAKDTLDMPFLDIRSTSGSSFNFDIITQKDHPAKVAFMQLDYLLLMKADDYMNGTKFTDDIMVLMTVSMEEIHLITKEGSPINSLADLKGRKVAIGNKAEGTYSTATYIQNNSKVEWQSKNISTQDVMKPLILDKIDAFFMVASSPVKMIDFLPGTSPAKFKLVSIEDVNGWVGNYVPFTIPAGTYKWQKEDVSTFGVPSVVVVNVSKLSEEEKQQLLQWKAATIENLENLKETGHPAWKTALVTSWENTYWPTMK
ncbi:MAG: TAXI family TRAP transporter solute-binding subunit [Bacteroidales bacterium]|nr:TAXI family TRAP transporter solute-binding subunit [Bacteroidales bacterium]